MHSRLTAAFVLLTLGVLVVFGVVRAVAVRDLLHDQQDERLRHDAALIATYVDRTGAAAAPSRDEVARLLGDDEAATVRAAGRPALIVRQPSFQAVGAASAVAVRGDVRVELSESSAAIDDALRKGLSGLVLTVLLLTLVAGVLGRLLAARLAEPFGRLAVAAAALGRGRFDLDLPDSSIAEARSVADSLRASARQLRERARHDREHLAELSHELRSPLTGLRLELDGLATEPDLPEEVSAGLRRCLAAVDGAQLRAERLLDQTRDRVAPDGPRVPLRELAQRATDHWTATLAPSPVRVSVEGDVEVALPPGPVEQLLDVLLATLSAPGADAAEVGLELEGHPERLRLVVTLARRAGSRRVDAPLDADGLDAFVREVGGRTAGALGDETGLRIWFPVR